jgi:hypothetical protein
MQRSQLTKEDAPTTTSGKIYNRSNSQSSSFPNKTF